MISPGRRWYHDACGAALGLELIGERWSLLIVRELMFGGRRFSELRAGLPGISANVLTMRLEGLEGAGILHRRALAPPASVQVYELTRFGYAVEPVLQELGRWATRSPRHDPTLPLSAASIMMAFRTMYSRERAEPATIGFRFGADGFVAECGPEGISVSRADPTRCAVIAATDPASLAAVVSGGCSVAPMEQAGGLTLAGDRALFERFVTWFPLPDKIA